MKPGTLVEIAGMDAAGGRTWIRGTVSIVLADKVLVDLVGDTPRWVNLEAELIRQANPSRDSETQRRLARDLAYSINNAAVRDGLLPGSVMIGCAEAVGAQLAELSDEGFIRQIRQFEALAALARAKTKRERGAA